MPDIEAVTENAAEALQPGTGRELAACLSTLPAIFTALHNGLRELGEWAGDLRGVSGSPGDLLTAIAAHAQAAAAAAGECSTAFRAENAHWLDGEACAYPPAEELAEDVAEGFVPDSGQVPGFALADVFAYLPRLAELIADQLRTAAARAEGDRLASPRVTDQIGAVAGLVTGIMQAADEAHGVYRHANAFWLDTRNARDYR